MATASITVDGDKRNINGGSSSDYLVLNDVLVAANSDLTAINFNAVRMTSRQAKQYIFANTSYVDLTDARLFLTNNANGQVINTEFEGRIRVGSVLDPIGFCEIHWGDKDNGGYSDNRFPLFGTTDNAVISCPNVENRIKLMSHLDGPNSSLTGEPGSKNGVTIRNNNAASTIRVSLLGASHTYGLGYTLPDPNGFKPNGTVMCIWTVGSNVTVRDIEFRDGYVDWRPIGTWATPTRGIFVSETWMKFLGEASFTFTAPLIFGNQDDPFEVVVGNSGQTGSYILHGIYTTGREGRIVYNNYMGLTWSTQLAMYRRGDKIRMENHLQLDYTLIDSFAQPITGAVITLYKKDPIYNATGNDVAYSGLENDFDTTTDADGKGNIGNGDGNNANNICVEAFCGYGSGGNVDSAYANKDHSMADYDSNSSVYYTIIKWGKKPIVRTLYTCKLSGETGEGKQSLGVIQLETALSLVSPTINDVPIAITDAQSFYDVAYKFAVDNKIALFCDREGDTIISSNDVVFDNNATNLIGFDGSIITVKTDTWNSSLTAPTVYFATHLDLDTQKMDAELHIGHNTNVDMILTFNKTTVTGDVLNDMANNTVTINLTGGSTATTSEAGTGNGQVNLVNTVPIVITVLGPTGAALSGAHVYLEELATHTQIINGSTDVNGVIEATASYSGDTIIKGWAREFDLVGDDHVPSDIDGFYNSSGFSTTVKLSTQT